MTFRSIWMAAALCLTCSGLAAAGGQPPAGAAAAHPLDPLSEPEIREAFALLKADPRVPQGAFFPTLVLQEPPKTALKAGFRLMPAGFFKRNPALDVPGDRQ